MNVYELAFASYIYSGLEDFDITYKEFINHINNNPDMNIRENRQFLLDWLNDWGCRNFYIEYHDLASNELHEWYLKYESYLPEKTKNIWEFTINDLETIEVLYDALTKKIASYVKDKNGNIIKTNPFGHTPSSKILFALRPKSLIPWDRAIRKEFKQKWKITTYRDYLIKVKDEIMELKISCQKNSFELEDIPVKLNKNYATIPKLIDEYHWITITKGCKPPNDEILKNWLKWNS